MAFWARDIAKWLARQFAGWAFGKVAALAFTGATMSAIVAFVTGMAGQPVIGTVSGIAALILVAVGLVIGSRHRSAMARPATLNANLCDQIWSRLVDVEDALPLMVFTVEKPFGDTERSNAFAPADRAINELNLYVERNQLALDPATERLLSDCVLTLLNLAAQSEHGTDARRSEELLWKFLSQKKAVLQRLREIRRP